MKTIKTTNAKLHSGEKTMTVNGELYTVEGRRSFGGYGVPHESFKVMNVMGNVRVLHSNDNAATFWEK